VALLALSAYFVYCYLQETKKLRIPALLCVDQLISSHRNSTQLNSIHLCPDRFPFVWGAWARPGDGWIL
jgi:hypothetical protein